ncbi:MAG: hypothetical protein HOO06_15830 [Bdellovibrionaceae bacterium]|jgi:hypothetical protein|nr:hypothetical protein [Pseudobdellovibrionaceae bacterium]
MKLVSAILVILMSGSIALANCGDCDGESCDRGKHKGKGKYFKKMDLNGDGKTSKEEFTAKNEMRFAKIDADSDGFITPEEMKAHHKKRKGKYKKNKNKNN